MMGSSEKASYNGKQSVKDHVLSDLTESKKKLVLLLNLSTTGEKTLIIKIIQKFGSKSINRLLIGLGLV